MFALRTLPALTLAHERDKRRNSKGISKRQKIDGPDILAPKSVSLTHTCMHTYTPFCVSIHTLTNIHFQVHVYYVWPGIREDLTGGCASVPTRTPQCLCVYSGSTHTRTLTAPNEGWTHTPMGTEHMLLSIRVWLTQQSWVCSFLHTDVQRKESQADAREHKFKSCHGSQ